MNCEARNAIYSKDRYWQGDGYCAENDVHDVAFINCDSFDNADGGWDVKAKNVVYVNCRSLRNKMNFRVWQHAFMYNCLSAYSFKHGGSWTTAGIWALGNVNAAHCTFHNNSVQQIFADMKRGSEGNVLLQDCLVSSDGTNATKLFSEESRVTTSNTVKALGPQSAEPDYVAGANQSWKGEPGNAFDSRRFGTNQGYHSSIRAHWQSQSAEALVSAAQTLLKHKGWDDFRQMVESMPAKRN